VNGFRRNVGGKMPLSLRVVCMETVAVVTSITQQWHSQVLGILRRLKDKCAVQLHLNLGGQMASQASTAKPFPW